jgi:hypothetical protein
LERPVQQIDVTEHGHEFGRVLQVHHGIPGDLWHEHVAQKFIEKYHAQGETKT